MSVCAHGHVYSRLFLAISSLTVAVRQSFDFWCESSLSFDLNLNLDLALVLGNWLSSVVKEEVGGAKWFMRDVLIKLSHLQCAFAMIHFPFKLYSKQTSKVTRFSLTNMNLN